MRPVEALQLTMDLRNNLSRTLPGARAQKSLNFVKFVQLRFASLASDCLSTTLPWAHPHLIASGNKNACCVFPAPCIIINNQADEFVRNAP